VRGLFDALVAAIEATVGPCQLVSLPCCIHLAAADDFLAVLPRRDRLEIRFTLHRRIDEPRIAASSQTSRTAFKHSVLIAQVDDLDTELLGWLAEASGCTDDERGTPAVPDSSGRLG
jgi:hypothetical protein